MIISFLVLALILGLTAHKAFGSISSKVIFFFFSFFIVLIPLGYLLSFFNLISEPIAWAIGSILLAILLYFLLSHKKEFKKLSFNLTLPEDIAGYKKAVIYLLFACFGLVTLINGVILILGYPNEWDSMTGHLVKCAYYIQNGNMGLVNATTWSVDYYPNALPSLQIYFYHIFGEKGFKVIHYFSYWLFVFSIYGISKNFTENKTSRYFTFLIVSLFPTALVQATTTETDLVLTASLAVLVFYILKLVKKSSTKYLILTALSAAIWVSLKVTFLLIGPAIAVLFIYLLFKNNNLLKLLPKLTLAFLMLSLVYVYNNGYIRNVKAAEKFSLGALSAPAEVMKWHGIENYSTKDKVKNLKLNMLRYTSDFLQLDGIRNFESGKKVNEAFRYIPNKIFKPLNLERDEFWVVYPFKTMGQGIINFYKERPYWGIISFGMLFPLYIYLIYIYFFKKERNNKTQLALILGIAAFVHFMSLCFSAPYDPIKGRYFMNMAVWVLPVLPYLFDLKIPKWYLVLCSIFVSASAMGVVSNRLLYPIMGESSIFKSDRTSQLTISRPEVTEAYKNFEKLVPENAIVALGTQQEHEDYVYPLWGKNFKRTLIPIHPFRQAVKPIPSEAEYLFYSKGVIPYKKGDIALGKKSKIEDSPVNESEFFLRKLK